LPVHGGEAQRSQPESTALIYLASSASAQRPKEIGQHRRRPLPRFPPNTAPPRDVNRSYVYAWRKGIKTLYYMRVRQQALEGTEVEGCVSCML